MSETASSPFALSLSKGLGLMCFDKLGTNGGGSSQPDVTSGVKYARRGGVSILAAFSLPLLIGVAAFAVDIGSATLESRRLQGVADAAALAAAGDPSRAQSLAQESVDSAGWPRAITMHVTTGSYARDASIAPANRFVAGGTPADAVRVALETPSPTFFATIFGRRSIEIGRVGTAARERFAAFSIGSRLAAIDGGIANAYLSALTGSSVSLSVLDYNGLVGADVDLFAYLDALRTSASLGAGTYDDAVAADVTVPQALSALAAALDADGKGAAAGAIRKIAVSAPPQTINLNALLDPGKLGQQDSGGRGIARIDSMTLATALLQLGGSPRQVSFDATTSLPGIASTRITMATGQPTSQSPWLSITDSGEPILRTAQGRIYIDVKLLGITLPVLGTQSIHVPIYIELASAEGRLTRIDCATPTTRSVTIDARANAGSVALAEVDTTRFQDFTTPLVLGQAKVVDTALIDVLTKAEISAGAAEPWQSLTFNAQQISAGTRQTVTSTNALTGIASSLTQNLTLTPVVLGLPLPLGGLLGEVGKQLKLISPAIDSIIALATGAVGVGYGQADVRVTGMRCGSAALVG